jgi:hypothetical protein
VLNAMDFAFISRFSPLTHVAVAVRYETIGNSTNSLTGNDWCCFVRKTMVLETCGNANFVRTVVFS